MTLTLHVDTEGWRAHLRDLADATPGLVPVAKGNGYGFGLARLAEETTRLGVGVLAVGMAHEVPVVRRAGFAGDVVVLTPWTAADGDEVLDDARVIVTVSRLADLRRLVADGRQLRVLIEVRTSMRRHGLPLSELGQAVAVAMGSRLHVEGWTIHLPMVAAGRLAEARSLASAALMEFEAPLWLSHLDSDEYRTLADEVPVPLHLRVGTALWLGAPQTRRVTARVLDVHPVQRGERVGYWQRRVPRPGYVVVVSGGTANGVAMQAPTAAVRPRQRLVAAASGSMEALGLALSPYRIDGRKRFFIEPPHMQSSLVFLPADAGAALGDEVPVEVRLTTVTVDRIEG